jgi:hypothetical protein
VQAHRLPESLLAVPALAWSPTISRRVPKRAQAFALAVASPAQVAALR